MHRGRDCDFVSQNILEDMLHNRRQHTVRWGRGESARCFLNILQSLRGEISHRLVGIYFLLF